MLTVCWAAKGGSGTTVYAAATALAAPKPTLIVDAAGDLPLVLGIPEPDGPGIHDWLCSDATPDRLGNLEHVVTDGVFIITAGRRGVADARRWAELSRRLSHDPRCVIVDAGTGVPPPELIAASDENLLVTRPCYIAVQRAIRARTEPSGIVLVDEPGRRLDAGDVGRSIGAPVVATVLNDPAIARAADAGLLVSRLPGAMRRQLRMAA